MKSGEDEDFIRKNEQSIPSYWLKCIVSRNFRALSGCSAAQILKPPAKEALGSVACTLVKDLYVSRLKAIRHPLQAL